ncbi:MAG TPA: hypothetical protein PKE47_07320 [Verrucomicrobiota bacterium]|nr:hypothetical protein [Verrucomicrobiota bacterium]
MPPRSSPYTFLGLPASIDLRRLVIHGFPKEQVTILGSWVHPPVWHDDGGITLRVRGARGRTAQAERSANLVDWAPWRTAVLDQLGEAEVTDTPWSSDVQFYRVRLPAE